MKGPALWLFPIGRMIRVDAELWPHLSVILAFINLINGIGIGFETLIRAA